MTRRAKQPSGSYANAPSGPLAQKVGGTVSFLLRDPHTDVVGTVSAEGTFGTPPGLGFQSDPTDPATGLVDMQTRLYAPTLGRFTTRDVLFGEPESPLSLNQFLYGLGNPLSNTDPTGMCANPSICPAQQGPPGRRHNEEFRQRIDNGGVDPDTYAQPVHTPKPVVRVPRPPIPRIPVYRDPDFVGTLAIAASALGTLDDLARRRTGGSLGEVLKKGGTALSALQGCAEGAAGEPGGCVPRALARGIGSAAGCAALSPLGGPVGCFLGSVGGERLAIAVLEWGRGQLRGMQPLPNPIRYACYGLGETAGFQDRSCNG